MDSTVSAVFVQYGALGVLALLAVIAVRVMFRKTLEQLDREKTRADRLEEQLIALNATVRSEYLNTIGKASQAISDSNRAVADALAAVRRSR